MSADRLEPDWLLGPKLLAGSGKGKPWMVILRKLPQRKRRM